MSTPRVDLNADLGEGAPHDLELLGFVTSANIACGVHAGDAQTMRQTVRWAAERGIGIGAHPSLRDREGFGRRELPISPQEAAALVREQLGTLREIAAAEGVALQHLKPHGALYNMAAHDAGLARAIVRVLREMGRDLTLFGLAGSVLVSVARKSGLRVAEEFFADRAYLADGTLAPRSLPGALIGDQAEVAARAVRAVREGKVAALAGGDASVRADTICLHGDTEGAAEFARAVSSALDAAGIARKRIGLP